MPRATTEVRSKRSSSTWNIRDKTVLVTGGTAGIGYETARELAAFGATVIVTGRDAARGAEAVAGIRQQTPDARVSFLRAYLGSLVAVRSLVEDVATRFPRLSVLVNNLGGGSLAERQTTHDGFEATLTQNFLSPFLLTNLLLPVLEANPPARIVNVNSLQHRYGRIDFGDLQSEEHFDPARAYRQAKLANLLFTYGLARRLGGTGVTVNAVDPLGTIEGTKRIIPLPWAVRLILPLFSSLLTPERAARSSIYMASSLKAQGLNGRYVNFRNKSVRSSEASYDEALQERVWAIGEELTGLAVKHRAGPTDPLPDRQRLNVTAAGTNVDVKAINRPRG